MKKAIGIRLNVPFSEKEEAKSLGAKWDAVEKTWYLPFESGKENIAQWLDETSLVSKNIKAKSKNLIRYYMQIRSGYPCHKCGHKMNIIASFNKPPKNPENTKTHEYALVWSRPKSFVKFASTISIPMKFTSTSVVKTPYALHSCPKCNIVQGDFYMFEDKDCLLPEIKSFYVTYDTENDNWSIE